MVTKFSIILYCASIDVSMLSTYFTSMGFVDLRMFWNPEPRRVNVQDVVFLNLVVLDS